MANSLRGEVEALADWLRANGYATESKVREILARHPEQAKDENGLLPCPFCGAEPNIQNHPTFGIRVFCDIGSDHAIFIGGDDEASAITAWNTRSPAKDVT